MKMTIRQKLLTVTLAMMLPLLGVAGFSYYVMVQTTRHESSLQIRLIATDVAKDLDDIFDKSFSIIDALATHPSVQSMDPAPCDRLFAKLLPSYPLHLNILAARMDGFNACSAIASANAHDLNYQDKEWFQRSSRGERIIGNLHISKLFRAPAIMIAGPVQGDDGTRKGVIGFPLNLDSIRKNIVKNWQLPDQSTVVVVDGEGNILVDTLHPKRIGTNRSDMPVTSAARKTKNAFLEITASDGVERLYYVTTPMVTDWRIIVGVPTAALNRTALLVNGRYFIVILLTTLLGLGLSLIMGRRITDNINRIVKGIKAIGSGDLDCRLKLAGNDELSDIAGYFNTMAKEHHAYEQELKVAALHWQTTFDAAHDLYLLLDRNYRIQRVNRATTEFLELPVEEIIGKTCYSLIHQMNEPVPDCPFTRMLESKRHEETELWVENKGVWVAVSVDPVFDEDGNLAQVVQIIKDITQRKRVERAFHAQFRQISAIFDEMNVVAHIVDPETHELIYLNRYGASLFGSWEGKQCHEVIGCGFPHPCVMNDEDLSGQENEVDPHRIYIYQNALTGRWYQCVEKRMVWVDGRSVHITLATDITDLKDMMQLQENLLSAVSHEMRTPLTAICGYTEFLLENEVNEVQLRDYLIIILRESRRLDDLLDNFLILQRLKAQRPTDEIRPLTLSPLMQEAVALFTVSSAKHHIVQECPHGLPPVLIRETHMRVLLNNLLSNAVKYSPKGGNIVLGARLDTPDTVTLWVRDEGIGMPPDVLEKIFDKFYQVERGDRRAFGGIGLGLALVREIVDAYGGGVRVESRLGHGSTFFVSLPVAPEQIMATTDSLRLTDPSQP